MLGEKCHAIQGKPCREKYIPESYELIIWECDKAEFNYQFDVTCLLMKSCYTHSFLNIRRGKQLDKIADTLKHGRYEEIYS